MITLTADSATELFMAACDAVRSHGRQVRPRGMATTEVLGAHLHLRNPRNRFVDLPPTRVINPAFAVAETLWILSGSDDPWIFRYNKALTRYADDGRLQGAYGPRIRRWRGRIDQLARARDVLRRDHDSRQAVIQLFDPDRDNRGHRDVPCTLGYRFFIRDDMLHMHTTMRSQDLWLGFAYDIFAATILHELLAGWLGVGLGGYHHYVDSLHLYAAHADLAADLTGTEAVPPEPMAPIGVEWDHFDETLSEVIAGRAPTHCDQRWAEFAAVMDSYALWTDGDRDRARRSAAVAPGPLGRALERWYAHLSANVSPAAVGSL